MFSTLKGLLCTAFALVIVASATLVFGAAQTVNLPDGSKLDLSGTCPVCGMKLGSSIWGPAAVVFKDGKVVGFDTTGDMFRYVLEPKKYGFDAGNIKDLFVTEHGTKKFIDAKQAFFVVGSDLKGPMGPEVVPFSNKADAERFSSEHKGKRVATYGEVTLADLKSHKKMLKMEHGMGGMEHGMMKHGGGGMKH
ncbi:MAG: nitrous oxide reductase accessory protein NosL [Desulfomonilaceae bacterium]